MTQEVHEIDPSTLHSMIKEDRVTLVDVREDWELAQSRIDGAHWNPTSDFDPKKVPIEEGKSVCFYCAAGVRSRKAAERFLKEGHDKAFNLSGGITAWEQQKLPTERSKQGGLPLIQQVFLIMGLMTLLFVSLGAFVSPLLYWGLVLMAANQLFVGATGICWMTIVLGKLQQ